MFNIDKKLQIKLIIFIFIILFFTTIFYIFFSHKDNWNCPESEGEHLSFFDLFWFSSVTWFTIGYGDIVPKTNILKLITIIKLFINYIILSILL
jgi:hypothetical protein